MFKVNDLFHGQWINLHSVDNLLNQIPNPSLIIEDKQHRIVQVNSELLALTAFSRDELIGNPVIGLMPLYEKTNDSIERQLTDLMRKNKSSLQVEYELIELDDEGKFKLIILQNYPSDAEHDHSKFINILIGLSLFSFESSINNYIKQAIEFIHMYFLESYVVAYQYDGKDNSYIQIASTNDKSPFSKTLKRTDVGNFSSIDVWIPGKRVLSEIHRFARKNNLEQLIEVNIGNENKIFILMLICFPNPPSKMIDNNELSQILKIVNDSIQKIHDNQQLKKTIVDRELKINIEKILFEKDIQALIFTDENLNILEMNPAAENVLGYSQWEGNGNSIKVILSELESIDHLNSLKQMKVQKSINSIKLHRRNGDVFPANIIISPINLKTEDRSIYYYLFSIFDQSDKEKNDVQISQLERQAIMGSLIANFAHDVRNPMNSIMFASNTLALKEQESQENSELIQSIQDDCNRINQLMESVL